MFELLPVGVGYDMRSTGVVSARRLRLLGAGVAYEGESKSSAALVVLLVSI